MLHREHDGSAHVTRIEDGMFVGERYAIEIDPPGNPGWIDEATFEALFRCMTLIRERRDAERLAAELRGAH